MTETVVREIASPARVSDKISLYASVSSAGFPMPGDDEVEDLLNVHDLLVKNEASTFFVKVSGNSMEGAGIFSGDILAIDRSITPINGKIVVAAINGELVVKKLGVVAGKMALISANTMYEPILLGDDDSCYVWGVVVGSVRVFT